MNLTTNQLVLAGLAVAVLVSLYLKGYIKLPSRSFPTPRPTFNPPDVVAAKSSPERYNPLSILDTLDSRTLGLAFAKAMRHEAENEIAATIARSAGDSIKATFTSPFSSPAPAGEDSTAGESKS